MKTDFFLRLFGGCTLMVAWSTFALAQPVTLQQATATNSHPTYTVGMAIDGVNNTWNNGWGVSVYGSTQTAVFETAADIGFAGGTTLDFTLDFRANAGSLQHLIGRVRLSVTTDDRSTFADGLANGGDVTATWTELSPTFYVSANGATMTLQGDNSLLVSGTIPNYDTYTIIANTSLTGITGIRLEALADPSLPFSGPGWSASNGNFDLTEFAVGASAIPEPSIYVAWAGLAALGFVAWRRKMLAGN